MKINKVEVTPNGMHHLHTSTVPFTMYIFAGEAIAWQTINVTDPSTAHNRPECSLSLACTAPAQGRSPSRCPSNSPGKYIGSSSRLRRAA